MIIGADSAKGLPTWSRADELLERARIAVVPRTGVEREEVERAIDGDIMWLDMPGLDVSGTMLRRRVIGRAVDSIPRSRSGPRLRERETTVRRTCVASRSVGHLELTYSQRRNPYPSHSSRRNRSAGRCRRNPRQEGQRRCPSRRLRSSRGDRRLRDRIGHVQPPRPLARR